LEHPERGPRQPHDQRFHASLILGFTDTAARDAFFTSSVIGGLSSQLTPLTSAIHAYDVTSALTFVKDGDILRGHEESRGAGAPVDSIGT